jgi:diaminopimelate epimerase
LRFAKYEGLGNDFVVIDAAREDGLDVRTAVALCDRRFGVGADGVILVLPPKDAAHGARMRVINADGSVPEMCGNGLRCAVLHLALARAVTSLDVVFETDAGPRPCSATVSGMTADVSVDMGEVRDRGDVDVDLGDRQLRLAIADAGNPHAILWASSPSSPKFADEVVDEIGPRVATHAKFPNGTNVEFASLSNGGIDLVVWERGVGRTLACGTGACAVAVVARKRGLLAPSGGVEVRLPGGVLVVDPDPEGRTRMRGPARRVFEGTLS